MKKDKIWAVPERVRNRILAMVRKELDWLIHNKFALAILFVVPLGLIFIVGNMESNPFSRENSVVYVIDNDNSTLSRSYIDSLRNVNRSLEIHSNHEEPEEVTEKNAKDLIPTKYLQAFVIIPDTFNESLRENRSVSIDVHIDGIDLYAMFQMKYEFRAGRILYQVEYQIFNSEVLYLPDFRPEREMSILEIILPLMLPNMLFAVMNMVSSQSIVADIPLKRILISPARKYEIILAKTIAYSFVGAILSFACMLMLQFVFQIPFVSFIDTFLIVFASTLFGVTAGLFFSSISKSRLQAAQFFLFSYIMQVLIVDYLRIEPVVHFMPIEIISSIFTDVAYRGLLLTEISSTILFIIGFNGLMLFLTYIALYIKNY